MAGRVSDKRQDSAFVSYSKSNEPPKREPTKAAGDDVTPLKHPVAQDPTGGVGSARGVSGKKKKARKKSNVCCQLLS